MVLLDAGPAALEPVAGAGEGAAESAAPAQEYRYTYAVREDDAERGHTLAVQLVDRAGNRADEGTGEVLFFDFGEPRVDGTPEVLNPYARLGAVVAVAFAVDDVLRTDPEVVLEPVDGPPARTTIRLTRGEQVGARHPHRYFHEVAEGQDGDYTLHVRGFEDRAGNRGVPWEWGELVVLDSVAPAFESGPGLAATHVGAGGTVRVSFVASEPQAEGFPTAVLVTEPQLPLACTAAGGEAWDCEVGIPAEPPEELEGPAEVSVELRDRAGNGKLGAPRVTLDFTPPGLTFQRTMPARAAADTPITVTVTFDELLREAPTLTLDPPLPGAPDAALETEEDPARTTTFSFS